MVGDNPASDMALVAMGGSKWAHNYQLQLRTSFPDFIFIKSSAVSKTTVQNIPCQMEGRIGTHGRVRGFGREVRCDGGLRKRFRGREVYPRGRYLDCFMALLFLHLLSIRGFCGGISAFGLQASGLSFELPPLDNRWKPPVNTNDSS
jgi:hypothetical protein